MIDDLHPDVKARLRLIARDRKVTRMGLRVACAIADWLSDDDAAQVAHHEISCEIGTSMTYAGEMARNLARRGHVRVTRGGDRGGGGGCIYRFVPPPTQAQGQ